PDARLGADDRLEHLHPLLERERGALLEVDRDRDDELVEDPQRAVDDVEVPVGQRIEARREERDRGRSACPAHPPTVLPAPPTPPARALRRRGVSVSPQRRPSSAPGPATGAGGRRRLVRITTIAPSGRSSEPASSASARPASAEA